MTDAMTTTSEGISITRVFDAPRELVFNSWITPESFAAWFGGPTAEIPIETCAIDARPGGAWKATMVLPDGTTIDWDGTFYEVVEPERLVLSMRDAPGQPDVESITVEFRDLDGKTEMTFRQTGSNMDAAGYEQAGKGWMGFFDTMDTLVATRSDW